MPGRIDGSLKLITLTDGSHAFRLRYAAACGRRISVLLHERCDCLCGCGGGWDQHLAYVELLRLRVKTWEPEQKGMG